MIEGFMWVLVRVLQNCCLSTGAKTTNQVKVKIAIWLIFHVNKYTYVEGKKELNNELNLSAKELIGNKSSSPFSDKEDGIIVNAMPNELETTKYSL